MRFHNQSFAASLPVAKSGVEGDGAHALKSAPEYHRIDPYVAAVTMSNPSLQAWRYTDCPQCGKRWWVDPLPDQSKKHVIVEEKFCSEYCKEEWEMLEADRLEQERIHERYSCAGCGVSAVIRQHTPYSGGCGKYFCFNCFDAHLDACPCAFHDWRGIDTGRMCAKCGKQERMV